MNRLWLIRAAAALGHRRSPRAPLGAALLLALCGCNGGAVVTLTSVPSNETFLTYRVGLTSVQLQTSNGRTVAQLLPAGTTVDLAQLVNLSEVVGRATLEQKNYQQVVVTLDYSSAQIVYDDGSINGVALTPRAAGGGSIGQVVLTLYFDPSNQFAVEHHSTSRLSLEFNLAASNIVNLAQRTVIVMPMMAASASPVDSKPVRLRGALTGVDTANSQFWTTIVPFDFPTPEAGTLAGNPSTVTTYEVNGKPATGTAGLDLLNAAGAGTMTVAYGTMSSSTSTTSTTSSSSGTTSICTDGSTPTLNSSGISVCANGAAPIVTTSPTSSNSSTLGISPFGSSTSTSSVSFSATQVLAGSSVQGSGFDRMSGIVASRSGNSFAIEDGTLISSDGTNTFIQGTSVITVGPATQVTQVGTGTTAANGLSKISVGSQVYAFGTASASGSGNEALDASAGRAQIWPTSAEGIVTVQGTGTLTLDLVPLGSPSPIPALGGRSVGAFDFAGTGSSTSEHASPSAYQVTTANLDLTNSTVGTPVSVNGYITAFGSASSATSPDFSAATLQDVTTINAELVLDWGLGTSAPFASYDTTQIVLNAGNGRIGARHVIQIGAQSVNILGIASDPLIVPNATSTNTVYTIGHESSGTYENFITFGAFVTQLQTELNGTVLATGITALGQYTTSSYTFSATSVTLSLND